MKSPRHEITRWLTIFDEKRQHPTTGWRVRAHTTEKSRRPPTPPPPMGAFFPVRFSLPYWEKKGASPF